MMVLQQLFQVGPPKQVMSVNSPQFNSRVLAKFVTANDSLCHPASNGVVERHM